MAKMFSTVATEFEPVRKDLFSLEFPPEMDIPTQFLLSTNRPTVTNPRKELPFKNITVFYKGKSVCEEMTVVFRDVIGPSVYNKLELWQKQHTDQNTGKGGYNITFKKTLVLNVEDPNGAVIQRFYLYGCFLTKLEGGELSQDSDDVATVTVGISFDTYELAF